MCKSVYLQKVGTVAKVCECKSVRLCSNKSTLFASLKIVSTLLFSLHFLAVVPSFGAVGWSFLSWWLGLPDPKLLTMPALRYSVSLYLYLYLSPAQCIKAPH